MRINFSLIVLIFLFAVSRESVAQLWMGAGAGTPLVMTPSYQLKESGRNINIQLESRKYCNLWYGLRIDHFEYEKQEDYPLATYTDGIFLQPEFRYIFIPTDCHNYRIAPWVQLMMIFSSIDADNDTALGGIGAGGGLGFTIPFSLFNMCWSVDAGVQYMAPNFILKDGDRHTIEQANIFVSINAGL